MKRPVQRIDFEVTEEGMKIRGRARSERGTTYTVKAAEVVFTGLSKDERKDALRSVLAEFLPEPPALPEIPISIPGVLD